MGKSYERLGFNKKEAPGMLTPILGGTPDEKPERYALYSPETHVHKNCPITLLIQGEHDMITSAKATRQLYRKLKAAQVPAILQMIPSSDHAFDLILPTFSPSAHNAYYELEAFLALMA